MLKTYTRLSLSEQQKRYILLGFAKELIRNSGEDLYFLEKLEKKKEEESGKNIPKKQILYQEKKEISQTPNPEEPEIETQSNRRLEKGDIENVAGQLKTEKYELGLRPLPSPREKMKIPLRQARITIPEQRLPPQFQYLQPTPTDKYIDLGEKLNPLLKDPSVKIIDCPGPDQNLIVTGTMGTKKTGIILNKDEISETAERFSKESKIPLNEGVFRVVVGGLIFLAIISEIVGSRFTIRKMVANVQMRKEI